MAIVYNTGIVRSGLVLHLDAANVKSYPGSGTVWKDLSGGGKNGSLVNGPAYDAGNKGAFIMDGTNDYVSVTNGNYLNTNECTISCWMYFDNITTTFTGYPFLHKNQYNSTGISANIGTGGSVNNRLCSLRFSTTGNAAAASNLVPSLESLPFNSWHQICLKIYLDSGDTKISLYINGNIQATSTGVSGNLVPNSIPLIIGAPGPGQGSAYMKGKLSNYKIYNRSLTDQELVQNFNSLRGRYGI